MSLRFLFGLGSGIIGFGAFAFLGTKVGSWLQGKLTEEELDDIEKVCKRFNIGGVSDFDSLSKSDKKAFIEDLNDIEEIYN